MILKLFKLAKMQTGKYAAAMTLKPLHPLACINGKNRSAKNHFTK